MTWQEIIYNQCTEDEIAEAIEVFNNFNKIYENFKQL